LLRPWRGATRRGPPTRRDRRMYAVRSRRGGSARVRRRSWPVYLLRLLSAVAVLLRVILDVGLHPALIQLRVLHHIQSPLVFLGPLIVGELEAHVPGHL